MRYLMKLSNQYEIEGSSEEDALEQLGDYLDRNNMTGETEFWDSIDVSMINIEEDQESNVIQIEVKGGMVIEVSNLPAGWMYKVTDHDILEEIDNELCHECGFIDCQCPDKEE